MKKGDILFNGVSFCEVLEVGPKSALLTHSFSGLEGIDDEPRGWYSFEALENNGWEVYEDKGE